MYYYRPYKSQSFQLQWPSKLCIIQVAVFVTRCFLLPLHPIAGHCCPVGLQDMAAVDNVQGELLHTVTRGCPMQVLRLEKNHRVVSSPYHGSSFHVATVQAMWRNVETDLPSRSGVGREFCPVTMEPNGPCRPVSVGMCRTNGLRMLRAKQRTERLTQHNSSIILQEIRYR